MPRKAGRLLALGQRLTSAGDHEGAIAAYREAAALDPTEARILLHESLALSELGRADEAAAAVERAKALAPGNEVADLFAATIRYDSGDMASAIAAADRALELVPANLQATGLKGLALLATGSAEEGRALVSRGLPGMSDAYRARVLAWCLAQPSPAVVGDAERAELEAELALLATVLDLSAAAFGARAGFETGYVPLTLAAPPDADTAWYGVQMRRFEPLRETRDELLEFHRSDPYGEPPETIGISPATRTFVGVLMRAYGRAAEAHVWCATAADEASEEYLANFYLGALAAESGDAVAARRHLTVCLRRAPGKLALDVWGEER